MRHARAIARALCLIAVVMVMRPACAQAWLAEKGELGFTATYNDVFNTKHYLPNGDELDAGHTRTKTIGLAVAWSPSNRFMLTARLPYVMTQYHGEHPHPGSEVDDEHTHATVTDLRVELHYQAFEAPFAFAPYVATVVPVRDYAVFGHAAPGRGLAEQWLGFFAGKSLEPLLPGAYLQLHYSYAFVQEVVGIAHDRSNADLELGYFLTPAWVLQAIGSWQWTHGGIDVPIPPSNPLYPHHDQLADDEFLNVGAGIVWFAGDRTSAYLNYTTSVRGRNGHKLGQGLNLGLGYRPRGFGNSY
jgi:hypothetical protein